MDRQVRNAVDAGEGDLEIKALRARLDADPANLNTRFELARQYQQKGFPDIAMEHLRLAVERAPESADAAVELAKLLRNTGRATDGAASLTAFAGKHQPNLDVWAWLGILRDDAGDWKGGEAAYRQALALAPSRDDLHNNLGYCLLQQGRKNEAESEFRAAIQLNPHSVIARNNLGTSLVDKPKEAVVHLQSVADPASAHNNVAVALMEAGNYAAAREEISVALSYNRQNTAALNNLRLLSELDGKPAEFKAALRSESRLSRLHGAWRRLWGSPPTGQETKDSGSSVASR
jgi:Flp pilus assembly protein TadD